MRAATLDTASSASASGRRTMLTPTRVTQLPKNSNVRQASAWHAHSLCVTAKESSTRLAAASAGGSATATRGRAGGPIWSSSSRGSGRCDSPPRAELHSCVQTLDGKIYAFGDASLGQTGSDPEDGWLLKPSLVDGLAQVPVNELAVGDHHTLARA